MFLIDRFLGNLDSRKIPLEDSIRIRELQTQIDTLTKQQPASAYYDTGTGGYSYVFSIGYDGEKNMGEMGPAKNYILDHATLTIRSRQAYLESEICQLGIKRLATWVIGNGLKLQSSPKVSVLNAEKIPITDEQAEALSEFIEDRYDVYCKSMLADWREQQSLHGVAWDTIIDSLVDGDVLVIHRYVDGYWKEELINAIHICTPNKFTLSNGYATWSNGNRIIHGVEVDERGRDVAYHVRKSNLEWDRIPAYGDNGQRLASMVYGFKYRSSDKRGLPLIAAVLESAKKLERYKEATLGSAEEAAKIYLQVVRDVNGSEENPLKDLISTASGPDPKNDLPKDTNGRELNNRILATTNKMAIDMPAGTKLESLKSEKELYFKDFFTVNADLFFATIEIPPNVAMQKYDSNFSSARAAIKDWEHTLDVRRGKFAPQFYGVNFRNWLLTEALTNKIQVPGFIKAWTNGNTMAVDAYTYCTWLGPNVPHIDPVKEVTAERLKLGTLGAHMPLTDLEKATIAVGGGESNTNIRQYARELGYATENGLNPVAPPGNPADTPPDEVDDNKKD